MQLLCNGHPMEDKLPGTVLVWNLVVLNVVEVWPVAEICDVSVFIYSLSNCCLLGSHFRLKQDVTYILSPWQVIFLVIHVND